MMPFGEALSPHLFRDALFASSAAVLIIRITNDMQSIIYANPAFGRTSGYEADEIAGRDWSFLCGEFNAMAALKALRAAIAERRVECQTFRCSTHSNSTMWLEMQVSPLSRNSDAEALCIAVVRDVTAAQTERERLERRAYHDALTGLPNRYLLQDRFDQVVKRAQRSEEPFAVAFIDLNDFKLINDTFGHRTGDQILRHVGTQLGTIVRASDTAARVGGDEFVLLLEDIESRPAAAIVDRVSDVLRQPVCIEGQKLVISCSVGMTHYPDDEPDAACLLHRADCAMYEAKRVTQQATFYRRQYASDGLQA